MILKSRLKQLLVYKRRGKILLEGVIHQISLRPKESDFTIYFPDLKMKDNEENIQSIDRILQSSDQLSLSWIKHGNNTVVGRKITSIE
jgi:hypothetical protein